MSPKTSTAEAGAPGKRQLTVTVEPVDATNKNVTFSIDIVKGLTVSDSGRIEWTEDTPFGDYTTKVTTEDGSFTAVHVLTLEDSEPVEEVGVG